MKKLLATVLAAALLALCACAPLSSPKQQENTVSSFETPAETEPYENVRDISPDMAAPTDIPAPGDTVTFGAYEQDNDLSNGPEPIRWLVLERTEGELWLLSKYILDVAPYDNEYVPKPWDPVDTSWMEDPGWIESSLCRRLNGEFLSSAFTPEQAAMLKDPNSLLTGPYGEAPAYRTPAAPDAEAPAEQETGDGPSGLRIRLLTWEEGIACLFNMEQLTDLKEYEASGHKSGYDFVFEYTPPEDGYECLVYLHSAGSTPYSLAKAPEAFSEYENGSDGSRDGSWWLLTDGFNGTADCVAVMGQRAALDTERVFGVRPLICIDLASRAETEGAMPAAG